MQSIILLILVGIAFAAAGPVAQSKDSIAHSKPWLMSMRLITHVQREIICSASLIRVPYLKDSSDIVITSCHCAATSILGVWKKCYNKGGIWKSFEIEAANHNRDGPDGTEVSVKAIDGQCHADWDRDEPAMLNDIAILKLETPLNFTDKIQPIELAEKGERVAAGTVCNVAGWGASSKNKHGSATFPEVLQEQDVKILENDECEKLKIGFNGTTQYCERDLNGKGQSCDGDSGGPLVCKKGDKFVQYGIVSYGTSAKGKDDCMNVLEVIHSDVGYYREWIDQNVAELNKEKNPTHF